MTLNVNVDAKLTCLSFDISCTVYSKGLTTFKINMLNFYQYETSLKLFTLLCCRKAALNHFILVMNMDGLFTI